MKKFIILVVATATLSSCAVVDTSMRYTEAMGRNIEPTQKQVVISPMLADLDILTEERISPYVQVFPYVIRRQ